MHIFLKEQKYLKDHAAKIHLIFKSPNENKQNQAFPNQIFHFTNAFPNQKRAINELKSLNHNEFVSASLSFLRSKTLNRYSKSLNRRSKTLNGHSKTMNEDYIRTY